MVGPKYRCYTAQTEPVMKYGPFKYYKGLTFKGLLTLL